MVVGNAREEVELCESLEFPGLWSDGEVAGG